MAFRDLPPDWRFAQVLAAQSSGGSSSATIYQWLGKSVDWSAAAQALLDGLLLTSPTVRSTADAALASVWLSSPRGCMTRSRSLTLLSGACSPTAELTHGLSLRSGSGSGSLLGRAGRSASASASGSGPLPMKTRARSREPSERPLLLPSASAAASSAASAATSAATSAAASAAASAAGLAATGGGAGAKPFPTLHSTALEWRYGASLCTYADREPTAPGAKRKLPAPTRGLSSREAQEERTCVWRGLAAHTGTRAEMQSASAYPPSSLQYRNMRHAHAAVAGRSSIDSTEAEAARAADAADAADADDAGEEADGADTWHSWLRGGGSRVPVAGPPLALSAVDQPFKESIANNNSYAWADGAHAPPADSSRLPSSSTLHTAAPLPAEHPSRRSCPYGSLREAAVLGGARAKRPKTAK